MSNHVPAIDNGDDLEDRLADLLDQTTESLEPTTPERALELYLDDKSRDCQQATVDAHRSRLGFFVDWCEDQDIDNLNDLSARDLHEFRVWRRQDLNTVSEKTQMDSLRVFIQWCETIDAVESGLFKNVDSPSLDDGENARDTVLHAERAREILDYLERYEYATTEHVAWVVLTETGMRLGAARALDVRDYRPDAKTPHVEICHRPETETPIKNKTPGERRVAVSSEACEVIDDYLQERRPNITDEHGRQPLLATTQGRPGTSTIRSYVYRWSRPCAIGAGCPHDRDPEGCEAVTNDDRMARCPSSVTPHPIRRGYITQLLRAGVPVKVVSDRCNVTPTIIDQHYDVRSEEDKMRQRQAVLADVTGNGSFYV
ncbi:tyrosine-type recombinase/integrase [Halobacterium bonnevillei]|uniref:Tyrosine-type recombinase/integrase n=1 Tax=Halobacterium bonnevillei TaxID=2692200 RepID=A0A6B0SNM4_9EURY|nr:tyrosine-type recombinase/integrase [Halobacterium bonnevillei]MXR19229.1 tyrosine-type recombinase/integrase [Halobacterium bonnevillei]